MNNKKYTLFNSSGVRMGSTEMTEDRAEHLNRKILGVGKWVEDKARGPSVAVECPVCRHNHKVDIDGASG